MMLRYVVIESECYIYMNYITAVMSRIGLGSIIPSAERCNDRKHQQCREPQTE
jgi:hypothetical protein